MIGTIEVRVNSARPNLPLTPMFAFSGSPSSLRIMDVPKTIGSWNITTVKLVVKYPNNTTITKNAVRNGNVWVATISGTSTTGKVGKGYEVIADGVDEGNNPVTGYVLGSGDVIILDRDSTVLRDVEKYYVKYNEDFPTNPVKGDLMLHNGSVKFFDGTNWHTFVETASIPTKTSDLINDSGFITISSVHDSTITIKKNGTTVDSFTTNASTDKSIDIAVPTKTSDLTNDSGFLTEHQDISGKVDKITGKGLSTLDVTQSMLDAKANVSSIPTKTSDLTNDSGFITSAQIPTPSKIQDATGNKINADGSAHLYEGEEEVDDYKAKFDGSDFIPCTVTDTGGFRYVTTNDGRIEIKCFEIEGQWEGQLTRFNEKSGTAYMPTTFESWDDFKGIDGLDFYWDSTGSGTDVEGVNFRNYYTTTPVFVDVDLATENDVPTKTSDLTNDSGFITASSIPTGLPYKMVNVTTSILEDLTINMVNDTGHVFTLPTKTTGKARDFAIVFGADNTGATITINPPYLETVTIKLADSNALNLETNKINIVYFTEIQTSTFLVARRAVA